MITEDYVDFEMAELLKQKGFDVPTWFYYQDKELKLASWSGWDEDWNNCLINNKPSTLISAPTIQMVMKWLREVHNICISVDVKIGGGKYYVCISSTENGLSYGVLEDEVWDTFEEACEASIKYCLENLINY